MSDNALKAVPLTADAFKSFGDVIDASGDADMLINDGRCERFHNRARLTFENGDAGVSLFRSASVKLPYTVALLERHPLGSQTFLPMTTAPFLVVVAPDDGGRPGKPEAFLAAPAQGINYLHNVWHAPLLTLEDNAVFAVVDRIGGDGNLEEFRLSTPFSVTI